MQSEWDYSIDTLSRAWLPAKIPVGTAVQAAGASGLTTATDDSQSPPPVTSLSVLRALIAETNTSLEAGKYIEGYEDCIQRKVTHQRYRRADPWTPFVYEVTLESGSPAGTEVGRHNNSASHREPKYKYFWVSGPDMELFQAPIDDDDSDPSTGYDYILTMARPLPAGQYRVFHNRQSYTFMPCNFLPADVYFDHRVNPNPPKG